MTTDFRALCAELIASWDADGCDWKPQHQARWEATVARARAALGKDGPAVPEGREPVAVIGELSDKRPTVMEIVELSSEIEAAGLGQVDFARAVLARWGKPTPVPPADGEVAELVRMLTGIAHWRRRGRPGEGDPSPFDIRQADRLDRAAELLERLASPACVVLKPSPELIEAFKDALPGRIEPLLEECHPTPVPVAERLPGPSDCAPWPKDSDASDWCWVGTDEDGGWNWEQRSAGCLAMFPDDFTHWLPAHALPVPEVK